MKTLIAAISFASLVAAPAFAQSHDSDVSARSRSRSARAAYAAVHPSGSPTAPQNRQNTAGSGREAALRECSTMSRQYLETTWGDMQMHQFRTCMMRHGQPE
jgi:hypothetical protein